MSNNEPIDDSIIDTSKTQNIIQSTEETKIQILEDELKIIEDTNLKFKGENENLKNRINVLNERNSNLENKVFLQFSWKMIQRNAMGCLFLL